MALRAALLWSVKATWAGTSGSTLFSVVDVVGQAWKIAGSKSPVLGKSVF